MQCSAQSLRAVPLSVCEFQLCCALEGQLFLLTTHLRSTGGYPHPYCVTLSGRGLWIWCCWAEGLPSLKQMSWNSLLCVYGETRKKKICTVKLKQAKIESPSAPARIDTTSVWLLGGRWNTSKLSKLKTWGNMEYWFLILKSITKQDRIVIIFCKHGFTLAPRLPVESLQDFEL